MRLRTLEVRDAGRMLEWMHDPFVVDKLQTNFRTKTIEDCIEFISNSQKLDNIHMAIADDDDCYMGTVSLKNITNTDAEFAITVCREAMGKGYSAWAMKEIIKKGFEEFGLTEIYWCVASDNSRALRFYDKNDFHRVKAEEIKNIVGYNSEQIKDYIWYRTTKTYRE